MRKAPNPQFYRAAPACSPISVRLSRSRPPRTTVDGPMDTAGSAPRAVRTMCSFPKEPTILAVVPSVLKFHNHSGMVRLGPAPSAFHPSIRSQDYSGRSGIGKHAARRFAKRDFGITRFWNNERLQSFGGTADGWFRVVGLFVLGLRVV